MKTAFVTAPKLLLAVRELYSAMFRFDQRAAKLLRIHASDLRCVNALENGPCFPSALAESLGLTRGAMTAMLDRLERGGLVERIRQSNDRRRYAVQLRPKFYRQADRIYGQLGGQIGAQLPDLSTSQVAAMTRVLERLAAAFDLAPMSHATAAKRNWKGKAQPKR